MTENTATNGEATSNATGVKGGKEDPTGRGKRGGIGGRRFYWGLIVFMLCRFSVVLSCVFFLISKTGILSFYFKKKRICQTRICHKPYRICQSGTNTP